MLDFQVVYVRDYVRLRGAGAVSMLRIPARTPRRAEELATVTSVTVEGRAVDFIRAADGSLLLEIPQDLFLQGGSLMSLQRPGVELTVRLLRVAIVQAGTTVETAEIVPRDDLQIDTSAMRVQGEDFSNAVEVRVNGGSVAFTVLGRTTLLCQLPRDLDVVESVEVLASTSKMTPTAGFAYMLGSSPSSVSGAQKLLQQFIKVLWTTRGSDTFNRNLGGNMQKFIGSSTDLAGAQGLTRIMQDVQRAASLMTTGQALAGLPDDETLAQAQILDFRASPTDPTSMELDLKLTTISGLSAVARMAIGNVFGAAQNSAARLMGAS